MYLFNKRIVKQIDASHLVYPALCTSNSEHYCGICKKKDL